MKLIELVVTGFKKIEAFHATNIGDVVVVTGKNMAGKSSVLSAIAALFTGISKADINKGTDKAEIIGKIGDYTITRRTTERGSNLEVTTASGAIPRPAEFLKTLSNNLAINPGEFFRMNDLEKTRAIVKSLGINLEEYDNAIKDAESQRLLLTQQIKREGTPVVVPKVERVDIREIEQENDANRARNHDIEQIDNSIRELSVYISELKKKLELKESEFEVLTNQRSAMQYLDVIDLSDSIEQNRKADAYDKYVAHRARVDSLKREHESTEKDIKELREARLSDFNSRANAILGDMKVDITDNVITVNDFKPSEWSHSQIMTLASKLGMASNPNAKIVIIDDAEAYDDESLKSLIDWAKSNDIQLIMSVRYGINVEGADNKLLIVDGKLS
jgi:hypothetical protein